MKQKISPFYVPCFENRIEDIGTPVVVLFLFVTFGRKIETFVHSVQGLTFAFDLDYINIFIYVFLFLNIFGYMQK